MTTTHIPWRRDPSWMTLGAVIPAAGSSPGHDAELAADGLGVLGSAKQLHGASPIQAVLGEDVPKLNNHLPVGSHLPGTGNKLLLALERDKSQWDWGEVVKKAFPAGQGGSRRLSYVLRRGQDAKLTSNQEEGIRSIVHKQNWCHSPRSWVTQGFGMELLRS